ncbi:hypothetical protein [Microbacterium sp. KNMS]
MGSMNDDVREALARVIGESRYWRKIMSDGLPSSGMESNETIADAILSRFDVTPKGQASQPVTEEQEWEYGRGYVDDRGKAFALDVTSWRPGAEADVERARRQGDNYSVLVRRRKAGPWEPVEAARETGR